MDHSDVNSRFVEDFLALYGDQTGAILDVGTGTARIPLEIAARTRGPIITAIDAAPSMITLAMQHVAAAGMLHRVEPAVANARELPYPSWTFAAVISNSIIHHIAEPEVVLAEMVRVTRRGGIIFVRDLLRPNTEADVDSLVATYTGSETRRQQQLFRDSLRAALTLEEIQERVAQLGLDPRTVTQTSDRHWTWATLVSGCGD
jgi:ubiquinone/menaquinone biosynthesis C-methylase UbiE